MVKGKFFTSLSLSFLICEILVLLPPSIPFPADSPASLRGITGDHWCKVADLSAWDRVIITGFLVLVREPLRKAKKNFIFLAWRKYSSGNRITFGSESELPWCSLRCQKKMKIKSTNYFCKWEGLGKIGHAKSSVSEILTPSIVTYPPSISFYQHPLNFCIWHSMSAPSQMRGQVHGGCYREPHSSWSVFSGTPFNSLGRRCHCNNQRPAISRGNFVSVGVWHP